MVIRREGGAAQEENSAGRKDDVSPQRHCSPFLLAKDSHQENRACRNTRKNAFEWATGGQNHEPQTQPKSILPFETCPQSACGSEEQSAAQRGHHAAPVRLAPIAVDADLYNHESATEKCPHGSHPRLQHPANRCAC